MSLRRLIGEACGDPEFMSPGPSYQEAVQRLRAIIARVVFSAAETIDTKPEQRDEAPHA